MNGRESMTTKQCALTDIRTRVSTSSCRRHDSLRSAASSFESRSSLHNHLFGNCWHPHRYFRFSDHELREDVTGGWTKMDNEHHDLYRSSNIVRMSKSKMKRWAGYVERMGQKRNACRVFFCGKSEWNSSEHLAVTESIILKWMINKYLRRIWNRLIRLGMGPSGELLWIRKWTFWLFKGWFFYWAAGEIFLSMKVFALTVWGATYTKTHGCIEEGVIMIALLDDNLCNSCESQAE